MKTLFPSSTKSLFVVVFFFVSLISVKAQTFSILPANTQSITVACESGGHINTYLSNPGPDELDFSYTILSNTLPECWPASLSDWEMCMLLPPSGSSHSRHMKIPMNSEYLIMETGIYPENIKGEGSYWLKLFQTSNPSNFQIITWNAIGCSTGDECTAAGISELANNTDFSVYPNPTRDFIHVNIPVGSAPGGSLEVYNLTGEKLITLNEIQHTIQKVDLHELPAGAYFIKFNSAEGALIKKIFKIR
jgi:hypothetical protein